MADNISVTPGTGANIAADDVGGVLHQRVKIALGADGTANDAVAGAGAVGVGVQRTTLASDDPAVASLASMVSYNAQAPGLGKYWATAPTLNDGDTTPLRVDVKNRQIFTQEKRQTYSSAVSALAVQSGATDFFTITGSASKIIIVKRVRFSASSSSTSQILLTMAKRSSANSGGTSTTSTNVPHDSTNAAASATVLAYTANPTTGTLVGLVRSANYTSMATNSNVATDIREFTFGIEEDQGIILRGTSEVLALNLAATAVTGLSAAISIEWREIVE